MIQISSYKTFRQLLAIALLLCAATGSSRAQTSKLDGAWVTDNTMVYAYEAARGVMVLHHDTATWNILPNELFLDMKAKAKGDTLLLHYTSCDCSRVIKASHIKLPKHNRVVAKCYPISDTVMGVAYVDSVFVQSVMHYVRHAYTTAEKALVFPPVFYRRTLKW